MDQNGKVTLAALAFAVIVTLMLFGPYYFAWSTTDEQWRREIVSRGLAEYCSQTGNWAWLGEC